MVYKAVIFLFLFVYVKGHVIVHTAVGWIKGKEFPDGNYTAFVGIPYAKLHHRNIYYDSVRYPRFKETFNAYNEGIACHQIIEEKVVGVSECLVLNIYVPKSASVHNRLPVMVWFHPGDFTNGFSGKSNWGPKYLIRHNVILVTMNYRLGVFGFMCLNIPEVSGNQGLKDQVLGLKWIQENIYWFGGDIEKVTLFGNGDSSRSVNLHLMSPSNEKLFNNVILQSGTALDASWLSDKNEDAPIQIVEKLGQTTNDTREAIKMMSSLDPTVILLVAYELGLDFKPCIEKSFFGTENILADYPVNLKVPKANGMSIMMGVTSNEAGIAYETQSPEAFEHLNTFSDRLYDYYDLNDDTLKSLEKVVREFYLGEEPFSYQNRKGIIDFESDFLYLHPAERTMRKFLDNNAERVFYYVFSYDGRRNYAKIAANSSMAGASQGDELGYLFDMKLLPETLFYQDRIIIDRMTNMWTNFARTGNPTPRDYNMLTITWPPVTQGSKFHYLDISLDLRVKTKPFNQRMAFWNLFTQSYGKHQKGYRDESNSIEPQFPTKKPLVLTKVITIPRVLIENQDTNLTPTCVMKWVKKDKKQY